MRASAAALSTALMIGCAHEPATEGRPAFVDSGVFYYGDSQGLSVLTVGAKADQPISRSVGVQAQVLADRIRIDRQPLVIMDVLNQPTGHRHLPNGDVVNVPVDAVTSASVSVTGGQELDKLRIEGTAGASYDGAIDGNPYRLEASARASRETDYRSYSGRARWTAEFFQRNTAVSVFAGGGHDDILPLQPPPGEADQWPASHNRIFGGASLSQLLSPSITLSGGIGLARLAGKLSNPYRRALVYTTLFPEELPSERFRVTPFIGLSLYLGWAAALHLRQGAYFDDWGVKGWIPEVALVKDLGEEATVSLRYRYYLQSKASFYASVYASILPIMTGDARLAPIQDHTPSIEATWTFIGERRHEGSVGILGAYAFSLLRFGEFEKATITAHLFSLGISGAY